MTTPNQNTETALTIAAKDSSLSMLAVIDRAARDPNVDVTKMERLLALAEQIHAREANAAYDQAMNAAQGEMRPISRDCHNPQTRSRYASYEAIDNAIRPIYTAHGFAMSFGSKAAPGGPDRVLVTCRVSHRAGHAEYVEVEMPADGKGAKGGDVMTKTHAVGSALSYGKRYLCNLIWNLSFGESDDDGNAASPRRAQKDFSREMKTPHWSSRPPSEATPPIKTPENVVYERNKATVDDVLPKKATELRKKGVLEFLRKRFEEGPLRAFAIYRKFIAETDPLEAWNLKDIPVANQALNELVAEIGRWLDGAEPPADMPANGEPELPAEIADVVWHIPPKGIKKRDYQPQTIGQLYAQRHDPDVGNRLFGTMAHFQASGWQKSDGTQMPPSREDIALREGLDKLADFLEAHKQAEFPDIVP